MRRRYVVTLECDVEIRDLTPERLKMDYAEAARQNVEDGVADLGIPRALPAPDDLKDQRILQQALLASPEALDAWLRDEVASELEARGLEGFRAPGDWQEMLQSIVETLPPRQRHRFREAIARGTFMEDAEEFFESTRIEIDSVRIEPED